MTTHNDDHRNADLPADVRAELLLREMTLEERCGQLTPAVPGHLIRPDGPDADDPVRLASLPPRALTSRRRSFLLKVVIDDA